MATPAWRDRALDRLANEPFDLLIVGAGATGAAVARDAALRGLRVALCDRGDYAGETSGSSSKLIHGGLRYLQYGDLHLVFEALRERRRLLATAPHLCRPTPFLFPAYRGKAPSLGLLRAGLAVYDALALRRPPAGSRLLAAREVYARAPWLRAAGLTGACLYTDCQTDDARLVLENVLDAEDAGAACASYVEIAPPRPGPRGALRVLDAVDRLTGAAFPIRARAVVNATGPFSDAFAALLRGGRPRLRATLGVHVVLTTRRLPHHGMATVIHSPRDGRLMFVLPAGARTYVGTTDTDFTPAGGSPWPRPGEPIAAAPRDIEYVLEAVNHALPPARLGPEDVVATFAGLRPLVAVAGRDVSATSREHEIWIEADGTLTVAGGKLTTMRSMAEETVDRAVELLRARGFDGAVGPCVTGERPLPGARGPDPVLPPTLPADIATHLRQTYGTRAGALLASAARDPALLDRLAPDLPYVRAELSFALDHDRATTADDVLLRRVPLARDQPARAAALAREAVGITAT